MWSSTKYFSSLTCRSQVAKLRWYGSHNCLRSYVALPGAYIEKCCQGDIGEGTKICSNAVVGPSVKIGKNCVIGAGAVIQNANISDNVVIHPGVCIGQDGFGFDIGKTSHKKKPQTLKVIVEHDVEIGANTTIDRGSWRDTVIGEGTKIDNLVQIGHNVEIGKHCLIAAQTGIAGSTSLGDHCLVGGQTGIAQHLKVGSHVQIAAKSGVMSDLESGKQYGGVPAVPIRDFHRQTIFLRRAAGN